MNRVVFLVLFSLGLVSSVRAANPAMPVIPPTIFNITDFGAVGDGVTDNTTNIQNTINAANAAGGGVVEIPAGVFMSGPFTLLSSINLHLDTNAILRMLPFGTYPGGTTNAQHMIVCNNVHDLEISGQGTFDGQGAPWWTYYNTNNTLVRPMILNLTSANRLFIHDVTYMNPPNHHCGLRGNGGNITISNLTEITDPNSPNTDGLNFVATNSIIENCHISDGDDNIAMGSTGPLSSGQAAFTTSASQLAVGTHSITAVYFGDGAFGPSTSVAISQTINQTNPAAGIIFNDTFGTSTVDSPTPVAPTPTSTSYEVLAGKSWSPAPTLVAGRLVFGIGATASGVIEAQAQFGSSPVSLNQPGDFVQLSVTFTNTAGILTQSGFWGFGLYNSGGSAPVGGGLNNALNATATTAATGAAQNWLGYFAQIGFTSSSSAFYDRKAQSGTVNNNQDLVSTSTSSSYVNPAAALVGSASTTPSVTLTVGATYTEILNYTLQPGGALQLQSQLYTGTGANGTLLSTMTATTGTTPVTTAFDSLAIGWRATGNAISTMTISAITVTGQSTTIPPTILYTATGPVTTLSWSTNYLGWLLQSNSVGLLSTNWSVVPGSDTATNFSITIDPCPTFSSGWWPRNTF